MRGETRNGARAHQRNSQTPRRMTDQESQDPQADGTLAPTAVEPPAETQPLSGGPAAKWLGRIGIAAVVAGLLAFGSWLALEQGATNDRLLEIEARLIEFDSASVQSRNSLRNRLDRIEHERLQALAADIAAFGDRMEQTADLPRRLAADIARLQDSAEQLAEGRRHAAMRINALETAVSLVQEAVNVQAEDAGAAAVVPGVEAAASNELAALVLLLHLAEESEPFPERYAALRRILTLGETPHLDAAAATGTPSRRELLRRLPVELGRAADAERKEARETGGIEATDAPFGDRLTRWLRGLVRIQQTGRVGRQSELAAAGQSAAGLDLETALQQVRSLPSDLSGRLSGWTNDAERRLDLERELDRALDLALRATE